MTTPGTTTVDTSMITPNVKVSGLPLNSMVQPLLVRTVVDTSLTRPDMFELRFLDREGTVLTLSTIDIGSTITISVPGLMTDTELIAGEVTAIEGDYDHLTHYTIVRGYEHAHRLQRARRSRTFLNMSDGDIVREVADGASIDTGEIVDPGVAHDWIGQVSQTDWEFLKSRAEEIGFDVHVVGGKLTFKPAPGMSAGGLGGALDAAAGALGVGVTTLTFGENLRWLRPRITSGGSVKEAEVRVWDPERVDVVSSTSGSASKTADIGDPAQLAEAHGGLFPGLPVSIPGVTPASANAYAIVDRPLAWGSAATSAADAVARGMAEHAASVYAEAEGMVLAAPDVVAGSKVELAAVPGRFEGTWYVTTARHELDNEMGYQVRFEVSGRHDRSLHGLATGSLPNRRARGLIDGLVPGVVSDIAAEREMYRVKVALPWLDPDFVTGWARVALPGLGSAYGLFMLPEVEDEVLVGFEFGDTRRPYVLGGLFNGNTELDLGGDAVKAIPGMSSVVKRGLVSRLGHHLVIDDDEAITSGLSMGNEDESIVVQYDDVTKKLTILCDSSGPPAAIEIKQNGAGGSISIEAGTGATLDIKSGGAMSLESAAGTLTLKGGMGVEIDGGPNVKVSGAQVSLG